MTFKCPDCGATLTDDSRFCKYCGAKIDDGVKRSEIKIDINKRVEDVAEVRRASYEEKESAARIRKMERENKQGRVKRIAMLTLLALCALDLLLVLVFNVNSVWLGLAAPFAGTAGIFLFGGIIYQLITNKW